jgi:putative salt-induced outer membrane protein YdiY
MIKPSRGCAVAILFSLTIPLTAAAQTPDTDLRTAEEQLATALTKKDQPSMDRLLAAGFVLRSSPDVLRETWMTNALTLCWGDRFEISDFSLVSHSGDVAIVSLLLTTHQDPVTCEPAMVRSLLTDVWTRQNKAWRLSLRHAAPPTTAVAGQFAKSAPPPPLWERTAELSLVATGGNTDTQTLGAGGSVTWRPGAWTTQARAAYVRSATADAVTAESLVAEARQARTLSPRADIFARAEYLVDRFAGIGRRTAIDGGFGWLLLNAAPHTLKVDGGFGATHESRLGDSDLTFASATASANYRWQVSRSAALTEHATMSTDVSEPGRWRLQNGLHLTAAMTRLFSGRVGHELKRVERPVPGFRKTDTVVSATLVARF